MKIWPTSWRFVCVRRACARFRVDDDHARLTTPFSSTPPPHYTRILNNSKHKKEDYQQPRCVRFVLVRRQTRNAWIAIFASASRVPRHLVLGRASNVTSLPCVSSAQRPVVLICVWFSCVRDVRASPLIRLPLPLLLLPATPTHLSPFQCLITSVPILNESATDLLRSTVLTLLLTWPRCSAKPSMSAN